MLKRITPEQALEKALIHKASLQGENTVSTNGMRKTRSLSTLPDLDNLEGYTSKNINFRVGHDDNPNMYFYQKDDGSGSGLVTSAYESDDDESSILLGYWDPIEESDNDDNSMPPGLVDLLKSYDKEINWLNENGTEEGEGEGNIEESSSEAENDGEGESTGENDIVGPLIQCTWNQNEPFYNKMNFGTGTDYNYTGCGATALAQILYYWGCQADMHDGMNYYMGSKKVPGYTSIKTKTVKGEKVTFTYSIPELNALPEFDYDNLITAYKKKNNHKYWEPSQANAVSQLMLYCACAAKSKFSPYGTGAYDYNLVPALKNYLGFPGNPRYISYYNNQEPFLTALKNELQNGRPCLFSANDTGSAGGHHFICDGYNGDLFHINWGWGGQYDGWFKITTMGSNLNPGESDGKNLHYDNSKRAIIGISPNRLKKGNVNQDEYNEVSVADIMVAVAFLNEDYDSIDPSIKALYKDGKYDKELIRILDFDNDGVITTDDILALVHKVMRGS